MLETQTTAGGTPPPATQGLIRLDPLGEGGIGGSWPRQGNGGERDGASGFDVTRFLHALQKRWLLALIVGLPFSVAAGALTWRYLPKTYTSTAVLRLAAAERTLVFETADAGRAATNTFELYKRTQRQLIRSRFVITPALRNETVANVPALQLQPDPVAWLEEKIAVAFPDEAEIMTVSLTATIPEGLDTIINSLINSYFEEVVLEERKRKQERLNDLEIAHQRFEADLRTKRAQLKQLVETVGGGDPGNMSLDQQNALQQYSAIRQQLQKVQFELIENELVFTHDSAADVGDNLDELAPQLVQVVESDPEAGRLKAEREQIQGLIQSIRQLVKEDAAAPRLAELNQRLKSVDRKLTERKQLLRRQVEDYYRQSTAAMRESARRKISLLQAQKQRLEAELQSLESSVRLPKSSTDIEMIRIDVAGLQDVVSRLVAEIERTKVELQPDSKESSKRVTLLSSALPAVNADAKSRMTKAAGASLMGFLVPFLLLVWWESQKDHIHSGTDLANALGLSLIGNVPLVPRRIMRRLSQQTEKSRQWRTRLSESVDAIAAVVLRERKVHNLRVVMVTSATAGEGKTTLAANLATSLASAGYRTILVDFDLRRPTLHRVFDLSLKPGVYDVLRHPADFSAALQETQIPRLTFLSAGSCNTRGFSGLTNHAMGALFNQLRSGFDFVLIDGSPVLPIVDARLTAQHVDGVIVSVLRDVSRVRQVQKACEILTSFSVPICGVVVTGSKGDAYPHSYYDLQATAEAG